MKIIGLIPLLALLGEDPLGPGLYAVTNARVHVGTGDVLDGATVVIEDGLIVDVGAQAAMPEGAWVIDGSGKHVYPGFVDTLSDLGTQRGEGEGRGRRGGGGAAGATQGQGPEERTFASGPEDRPSTTTWRSMADEVKLEDPRLETWRERGFTSAVTAPSGAIFPGQAAFINLGGSRDSDMVVATPVGILVDLDPPGGGRSYPGSLMGVVAYIHQTFLDAAHYRESFAIYEASPLGKKRPAYDRALEPLALAQANGTPVLFPATRAHEIERVIGLARDASVRPVIYGGHEAGKVAELLREANAPVLIDLTWPTRPKDADPEAEEPLRVLRLREEAPGTPAALERAGVRFAFYAGYAGEITSPGDAMAAVRRAIEAGLSSEGAVSALSLSAATIFGVSDRTGSLERGKIANLFITDGAVFEEGTKVETVFVDGVKHEVRAREESGDEGTESSKEEASP